MKYIILHSHGQNYDRLAALVNDKIAEGFVPLGGLSMVTDQGRSEFAQAMVKYTQTMTKSI